MRDLENSDDLKRDYSLKYRGKNNPNSKIYLIEIDDQIMRFEGRLELKEFLNKFNSDNNFKGPNRVSLDNLLFKGFSIEINLKFFEKP